MRIPPGARVYLTTVISLAGVALATWSGMQAGSAAAGRGWWTLGAVVASVTAAGVPAYEQIRKERMRARAQRAAVDAAVAMRVTMNGALDPIVRQLGRVATAAGQHDRDALAEATIPMVLDSAAHLTGSGRVRACLLRFTPGTPGMLQTYRSFAAVPVAAGTDAFGVLMVDALEPGGIPHVTSRTPASGRSRNSGARLPGSSRRCTGRTATAQPAADRSRGSRPDVTPSQSW